MVSVSGLRPKGTLTRLRQERNCFWGNLARKTPDMQQHAGGSSFLIGDYSFLATSLPAFMFGATGFQKPL
jgi:hypothetical protein